MSLPGGRWRPRGPGRGKTVPGSSSLVRPSTGDSAAKHRSKCQEDSVPERVIGPGMTGVDRVRSHPGVRGLPLKALLDVCLEAAHMVVVGIPPVA